MSDETGDASGGGDADTPPTVTITFEAELDEIHAPAWDRLCAMSPDRQTARDQLAERVKASTDFEAVLYRLYRKHEQRQQQTAQQLLGGGGGQ